MRYKIRISGRAKREISKIDRKDQLKIAGRIDKLAGEPHAADAKKLTGARDLYRVRSGNYRIIYRVETEELLVLVIRIGHRREVYRRLGDL